MQLGLYTFGNAALDPATGERATSAQATRDLLEAIQLADQVGLDYFGIGEHHTRLMPVSSAATILAAAASTTRRIRLGSSVTVLSTDDPVRVFQQFATLDALSNGRAEITAGRGSSTESFPLFGYDLADYDVLYREKLELLLAINQSDEVTWRGTVRPALDNALVVPRPDGGHLPIWVGTGGSPGSSVRAGQMGLPVAYGIIGGKPERFAPLVDLYRQAFTASGAPPERQKVSVALPGFIAETDSAARDIAWPGFHTTMSIVGKERGWPAPSRAHFDHEIDHGALFIGEPESIAERILRLHGALGHMRQFIQMDSSGTPQRKFLRAIELLGTKVKPLIDAELGPEPDVLPA